MGIEYHLKFQSSDPEALASVLRKLPFVREIDSPTLWFYLGDTVGEGMPEAMAQIEPNGLYFCDNCGLEGRALLGRMIAKLVGAFGPVTIEEL